VKSASHSANVVCIRQLSAHGTPVARSTRVRTISRTWSSAARATPSGTPGIVRMNDSALVSGLGRPCTVSKARVRSSGTNTSVIV
jgi:hypothetical protein